MLCGSLLAGIAVASWFLVGPTVLWTTMVVGFMFLLPRRPRSVLAGLCMLAFVFGAWRTQDVLGRQSVLWETAQSKPAVSLSGYVDGDFEATASGGRYTFRVLRITDDGVALRTSDRVLVSGPVWIRPRQGQWLVLSGKIQQPKNFADFDYIGYLAKEGIHATMYFPTYDVPQQIDGSPVMRARVWAFGKLASVRLALMESIAAAVPSPESGYLAGILVGAKGNIGADLKEAFARTGTSHIVALSGYNITIIATVLMALLAPLGTRRSYWVSILTIALFTLMVGAGASVVRAAIMGVLAMTATRLGRLSDASVAMAVTAALMCVYNPLLLRWDVGFQLSFAAFAGIVYIQPLLEPWIIRLVRFRILATLISTTLAAQIAVLPLLLHTFGMLAVYTLPVNMLVLPLVPVAMALGFATAVAGIVWAWAGLFVGQSAWLVAAVQLGIVRYASALPHATFSLTISTAMVMAVYTALAVWLIASAPYRQKLTRTN